MIVDPAAHGPQLGASGARVHRIDIDVEDGTHRHARQRGSAALSPSGTTHPVAPTSRAGHRRTGDRSRLTTFPVAGASMQA